MDVALMLTANEMTALAPDLLRLAARAGEAILEVYRSDDFQTERKPDDSPLTLADRRSHEIIDAGLRSLAPSVPILSEEGIHARYRERRGWEELWLVDPLDGTKEFVKRNGEFTVNIALVQHGEPLLGVIFAPVREEAWVGIAASRKSAGVPGMGRAWKLALASSADIVSGRSVDAMGARIRVRARDASRISIIASRTHLNRPTREFIDRLSEGIPEVEIVNVGSSLKLCYVAEGRADVYPRYAPTSEWDTAAGHAIVRAAGGEIYQAGPDADEDAGPHGHSRLPLRYNKENLLNPWFVVRSWDEG